MDHYRNEEDLEAGESVPSEHAPVVYFVRIGDPVGGTIKIGTTRHLLKRVRNLRYDIKDRLTLLSLMPGGRETEQATHRAFAHLARGHEIFEQTRELVDYAIGRLELPDDAARRNANAVWREFQ